MKSEGLIVSIRFNHLGLHMNAVLTSNTVLIMQCHNQDLNFLILIS